METSNSAPTPKPPYYAVIFTSIRTDVEEGYRELNDHLFNLVQNQDGYLGYESFRNANGFGVTISYWRDHDAMKKWKHLADHVKAQEEGRKKWYKHYKIRICKIEHDYEFNVEG